MQEFTISKLQEKMESREMTARQIAEMYLDRIKKFDEPDGGTNALIELNPDALTIADQLDDERSSGKVRGSLHGIPVLIKDNIDTCDQMTTTAGSLALDGNFARRDAFLVERLRDNGALILGKTNLSEWANFRGSRSTSGWSSRGGLTRNPYALNRTACGSSSGSAVAVAANFCTVAVGTETDGSIICPAQTNGIVGIKPTLGLISRTGVIPIAHSQDTAGPMARTVEDAVILLGALAGVDEVDRATRSSAGKALIDYTPFLNQDGLNGAHIGVARSLFGSDPRVLQVMDDSLETMKAAGAILVEVKMKSPDVFKKSEIEVLLYEFKDDLNGYLVGLGPNAKVRSMKEVIKFNEDYHQNVMPYFGQERFESAVRKGPLTTKRYLNALEKNHRLTRDEGIDAVMQKHNLDAIVCPSGGPAWLIDLINGDGVRSWDTNSTSYPAVAGYPHITVPAGYIFGLPVGLSFFGGAWQEPMLIKLAYAFEHITSVRVSPEFLPTADLTK